MVKSIIIKIDLNNIYVILLIRMNHLFCDLCDNMLVTKIEFKSTKEDEGGANEGGANEGGANEGGANEGSANEGGGGDTNLINYCRSCNFSTDYPEKKNPVYHLNYNLELIKREHIVNKFTAKDNTLPRALGIKCPNETCPSSVKSKKSDIRYIKYDDANMKYIYICIDCNNAGIEPNIW
jgi:hypothetical protein